MEFVPQSIAASVGIRADATGAAACAARGTPRPVASLVEVLLDPAADGVVAAGEVPGVVGVEALHALAGAADAAARAGAVVVRRDRGVALGRVAGVGVGQRRRRRPRPRPG